ncbi:AUGMIN subunit 1-like [Beta vulgaris subsp. vulgaris]|uniref:AUGMIN subunit 1-like n=1 Tax=Beta vulgaris subsp. vulgaris TaxID=3555 RepID=UPI0025484B04|nr:AUGMIN subunit 1-like [Beta vulgaris subsp. vulgaris]
MTMLSPQTQMAVQGETSKLRDLEAEDAGEWSLDSVTLLGSVTVPTGLCSTLLNNIYICYVLSIYDDVDGSFEYLAARIRELLENVGLAQESLPSSVVGSAQVLASVANLLNIRDTELSSFLVSMGDVSLRKSGVEEKRAKVQKESKVLLDYTRKAIARLTYLKRVLAQLEDEVAPCEAQIENWKTNLPLLVSKEREYNQRYSNQLYELLFNSTVLREVTMSCVLYLMIVLHFLCEICSWRLRLHMLLDVAL